MEEFHYSVPWRTRSAHPGHHRGQTAGGGYEFQGHTPLLHARNPRNLDIRATLKDPFGEFKVRQFRQTSLVPVFVIADLSASMNIGNKPDLLARLAAAIAHSAARTGDPFSFIGISDRIEPSFLYPLRRYKRLALELAQRIKNFSMHGQGLGEGCSLTPLIGHRRSLIFLLSDYHFRLDALKKILEHLQPHDVVPVVLWLEEEWQPPVRWGWMRLREPESGHKTTLWFRPDMKHKLAEAFEHRRTHLINLCRPYGRPPFFVISQFVPDAFSRYFLDTCA